VEIGPGTFATYNGPHQSIYFHGSAPEAAPGSFGNATLYYLPGTPGWGPYLASPWVLPYPVIADLINLKALQTSPFAFVISWATNASVVVEATSAPLSGNWTAVRTNTLSGGWSYFSDPDWAGHSNRFYRVRSF
jgi:hypothetical protein